MGQLTKTAHVTEYDEDGNIVIDRDIEFKLDTFINKDGKEELDEWFVEEEISEEEYSAIRLWADEFGHMKQLCEELCIKY